MVDQPSRSAESLSIAFIHPDLGLGGAERLIVDAAVELAHHGHKVDVYTAYYDPNRCFQETLSGEFQVFVRGVYLNIRGKSKYDVVIVDQVSAAIPPIKWFMPAAKVLFYCHFPDLLLANPRSALHLIYRLVINWLEEITTGMADTILVNSRFTRKIFAETFRKLHKRGIRPVVLYPAVEVPSEASLAQSSKEWANVLPENAQKLVKEGPVFVSINRFERKKGIQLAVEAFYELLSSHKDRPISLIVAGGYDRRLRENVELLSELARLTRVLRIRDKVVFLPSFTDEQKAALLSVCTAVLYTPENEHFGIVPLEAMAAGRPVIACSSGGPLESVVNGKTGYLVEPSPEAFASAMAELLDGDKAENMGVEARRHVQRKFSKESFGVELNKVVVSLANVRKKED